MKLRHLSLSVAAGVVAAVLLIGCAPPPAAQPMRPEAQAAQDDLAKRLGLAASAIKVVQIAEVEWPDASLGCPKPEMMYAQVITPGYRIVLEAAGKRYEYHTGGATVVLCEK